MILSILFAVVSTLSGTYAAIGPVGDLQIVNKDVSPDGYSRSAVLVNGVLPGPLIVGNKSDNFRLNVHDLLRDTTMLTDTSIHWHGLFQKGTNWADGPSFVTRCAPITPNNSFLYDFKVPDQAGTFWYHSHLSTQYCDGLRGPLVVYDPTDPHRHLYESTVITLADWYHYPAPAAPKTEGPVFNSTLINGLGRYAGGPLSPLAVLNVTGSTSYRFRLVSMSCAPSWIFSIDNHTMTIIEVDGVNHQPLVVDSLEIFAGQRYSFILNANQPMSNYWVRAQPMLDGSPQPLARAILRYAGAIATDPTTSSNLRQPLVETALHPLVPIPVPGTRVPRGVVKALTFVPGFDTNTFRFTMNGTAWASPTVPVLLQILSGAHTPKELLPRTNIYELPRNASIEISIVGGTPGSPHPFHLHGHNFHVIRSAGNSTYNYDNPVIRDTVSTGNLSTDLVTFRSTGFLHCDIDWHLDAYVPANPSRCMAVVLAEDIPTTATMRPPLDWSQLCPTYNKAHGLS
ncbi:laccase 2 precursor [Mycena latifolia]|nr:laccase 2 precursor [Mycena latifolia]